MTTTPITVVDLHGKVLTIDDVHPSALLFVLDSRVRELIDSELRNLELFYCPPGRTPHLANMLDADKQVSVTIQELMNEYDSGVVNSHPFQFMTALRFEVSLPGLDSFKRVVVTSTTTFDDLYKELLQKWWLPYQGMDITHYMSRYRMTLYRNERDRGLKQNEISTYLSELVLEWYADDAMNSSELYASIMYKPPLPLLTFSPHSFKVTIDSIQGEQKIIQVCPNDTIRHMKHLIWASTGTQPHQQRLLFSGKLLDESKTVKHYEIQPLQTVFVIPRRTDSAH